MPDRLARAAQFVVALQAASHTGGASWRAAGAVGKAAGIEDPDQLAQAVRDAVAAGLIYRRVDDDAVLLTDKGRGVTAD